MSTASISSISIAAIPAARALAAAVRASELGS